jgi:TorA maturation chaperone TorD
MSEDIVYAEPAGESSDDLLRQIVYILEYTDMKEIAEELKEVIKQASNEKERIRIIEEYSAMFIGEDYLHTLKLSSQFTPKWKEDEEKWLKVEDTYFHEPIKEGSRTIYHADAPPDYEKERREEQGCKRRRER